jgi:hypothetical protein
MPGAPHSLGSRFTGDTVHPQCPVRNHREAFPNTVQALGTPNVNWTKRPLEHDLSVGLLSHGRPSPQPKTISSVFQCLRSYLSLGGRFKRGTLANLLGEVERDEEVAGGNSHGGGRREEALVTSANRRMSLSNGPT